MNNYKTITLLLKITSLLLIKITPFSYYVIFVLLGEYTRGTRVRHGYAGQYTRGPNYRARRVGAFRDRRVGSTHCVPRFVLHFHTWHVGMARRVDAAWVWRVLLARRVDAAWDWRVLLARRVDAAWDWRVFLARRVDAAWKRRQVSRLSLLSL